jgi:hypothetical protein
MSIQYTRQSADSYTVWRDAHRRIGVVQKIGTRWLAIAPPSRTLGSFANMSEAGNRLAEEDSERQARRGCAPGCTPIRHVPECPNY